jgi:aminopeptidase N
LQSLAINGVALQAAIIRYNGEELTIAKFQRAFYVTSVVKIYPAKNFALEGLYLSKGMYCTQCEPEGFRKITYYLDRPDVLSLFTTTITADKQHYPTLLANGNLIAKGMQARADILPHGKTPSKSRVIYLPWWRAI